MLAPLEVAARGGFVLEPEPAAFFEVHAGACNWSRRRRGRCAADIGQLKQIVGDAIAPEIQPREPIAD